MGVVLEASPNVLLWRDFPLQSAAWSGGRMKGSLRMSFTPAIAAKLKRLLQIV